VTALLAAAVLFQIWDAWRVVPVGASGYEDAAEYVLAGTPAPTVLYSASVDTGYFVFFIRKHDPEQQVAVLRSDKLLTTSRMAEVSIEDRISSPEEVYPLLRTFGTRYIVIEDRPSGSRVLDWLRAELLTARFAERLRVPVRTSDRRLQGVSLVVYEFLDAGPADPNAELDLNLPLVGRSIRVRLSDVVGSVP
jgi:hypothetical protein